MRFVCLGYHDERVWAGLPADERRALLEDSLAFEQELRRRGHFVDGTALQGSGAATTLRFDRQRAAVTDGPFAETKEQLGGFMVLEADDLHQAIELLSQLPCMRVGGSLEIRPVQEQVYGELTAANAAVV